MGIHLQRLGSRIQHGRLLAAIVLFTSAAYAVEARMLAFISSKCTRTCHSISSFILPRSLLVFQPSATTRRYLGSSPLSNNSIRPSLSSDKNGTRPSVSLYNRTRSTTPPSYRPFTSSTISPITVPPDRIDMTFSKSSGSGGQNVNKVNTQVEIGFQVSAATWMPLEVRERFEKQQASRINQLGYFRLAVQEHRTQVANRKTAMQKLQDFVQQASVRPKERNMKQGISPKTKEQRKEFKRRRSEVKNSRRRVDDY
ncbi:hypothetical protein MPSEU_001011700 [Mayamaea pseudoterrestris]|nr:hypothetical protein MPSEU_001011700 [Mayamaea pseudoterrestris]